MERKENIASLYASYYSFETMYKRVQTIDVEITDVGEKNQCYGQLEDGMAVFVQGAVAVGDRVEAQIFKVKKNYLAARLIRVRELLRAHHTYLPPFWHLWRL